MCSDTPLLNNIKKKVRSYTTVDDEPLAMALGAYRAITLRKGERLSRQGDKVNHFYYLERGCISYYKMEEDAIKVLEFYTQDVFFTDLIAYVKGTPTDCYLEALEDSTVLAVHKDDAERSFASSHQLERFGRLSMQEAFVKLFNRVDRLNNRSNEERYLRLVQKRPDLLQRVPQYLIASYLGITPVGLSKLRKRLGKG
ncbi:Crp/Fnr family transcriptional regulator [Maribacter sp. 2307ULW6-5]|uniref:Crp/Fnr family transcriptional regulator n=1 Tax=Maribacter sp. 2307ULW6-5 TaxID=3386275 RepID=UPI0039BC25F0